MQFSGWENVVLVAAGCRLTVSARLATRFRTDVHAHACYASAWQVGCRGRLAKQCKASLLSMYARRSQYLNGTTQQCIDLLEEKPPSVA